MKKLHSINVAAADRDRFAWIAAAAQFGSPIRRYRENSRESLDRRLDQALEETFPASDPVSVVVSQPL